MIDLTFKTIVGLALASTVVSMFAEEIGSKTLPQQLKEAKSERTNRIVASSKVHLLQYWARLAVFPGYFLSLVALAFYVPYSHWSFLLFTCAWIVITTLDAPHILPRIFVPVYEVSLILNGAVLALCFLSPISLSF